MKTTGVVRKIDQLGRVVLPKGLRSSMEIEAKDPLEIYVDEDSVILKKYQPGCIFCGSVEDIISYKGKKICKGCKKELIEKAQ